MIKLFMRWLIEVCNVFTNRIHFEIYIHKNSQNNLDSVKKHWSEATGFPAENFKKIYFKRHKIKTNRRNIGNLYYGTLRVRVSASSSLLRRITGWTEAITGQH